MHDPIPGNPVDEPGVHKPVRQRFGLCSSTAVHPEDFADTVSTSVAGVVAILVALAPVPSVLIEDTQCARHAVRNLTATHANAIITWC